MKDKKMSGWKTLFDSLTLEKGRNLVNTNQVVAYEESSETNKIHVTIAGNRNAYITDIILKDNQVGIMKCQCVKARSMRRCEHMAAAMIYGIKHGKLLQLRGIVPITSVEDTIPSKQLSLDEYINNNKETEKMQELEKKRIAQEKLLEEKRLEEEKRLIEEKRKQEVEERIQKKKQEKAEKKAEIKRKRKEAEAREKQRLEELSNKVEEQMKQEKDNMIEYEDIIAKPTEIVENNEKRGSKIEESYDYFQFAKLISKDSRTKKHNQLSPERILKHNKIRMDECNVFYAYGKEKACDFRTTGFTESNYSGRGFNISFQFTKDRINGMYCECPKCGKNRWGYYYSPEQCDYMAAAIEMCKEYLKNNSVVDATDESGQKFMSYFQSKSMLAAQKNLFIGEKKVQLIPKVFIKGGVWNLAFKIGMKKTLVVKDLFELYHNLKTEGIEEYGKDLTINHSLDNFTEESIKWIDFIKEIVQEESVVHNRIAQITWRENKGKLPSVELYGWRIEQFYDLLGNGSVEFENRDENRSKALLNCGTDLPENIVQILPVKEGGQFAGVKIALNIPDCVKGREHSFFIKDNHLNRIDEELSKKMEPLIRIQEHGNSFMIGRNNLTEFYDDVVPELEKIATVIDSSREYIEQYVPKTVNFSFYLDAQDQDIQCKVISRYEDKEYLVSELAVEDERLQITDESKRQIKKEVELVVSMNRYFNTINREGFFSCGGDERRIFEFLSSGIPMLSEWGEVRCTKRFQNINRFRRPKVKMGVSVSSGLLDLNISTEDITEKELLEVLSHYKLNQKYYRLKSGEFVDTNDEAIHMLVDMMQTMHLSTKEFVNGKMHLPAYRALYLDKMFEEYESVYSSRDQIFREMIKNMKSIHDADYDLPDSLEGVLRKYQKNGFRWLRTLQDNSFGGILADDMGLGKTLQIISVMASLKKEGKTGCNLIISPASLVYNWGDEFDKFAPEMKVGLVLGSQDSRKKMITKYQDYDALVTSYDLLKRDIDQYEDKEFLIEVIDEAQFIKNHTTAVAKAVKIIKAQSKFALTGTPIENRISELWSIFDYLMPGFLYGYDTFKREIETPIVKNQDETSLVRLQKMVSPFILRRCKADVLKDLPDKLEENRVVSFDETQQKLYDAQVLHMKNVIAKQDDEDFNKNKIQILAEITKLRQICCDPSLCYENYKGESAKVEGCMQLVDSAIAGGHKILLFSQFTSMFDILEKRFEKEGIDYYKITGETSKEKRMEMVKKFNSDDTPLFLISLKAGGVGLNLTGADVVIHYDPWWNVAVQNQATDRAHRIGQTKKVTVYKMIVKNTIEEKIEKLQQTKKDLADSIINTEATGISKLSKDDLLELL